MNNNKYGFAFLMGLGLAILSIILSWIVIKVAGAAAMTEPGMVLLAVLSFLLLGLTIGITHRRIHRQNEGKIEFSEALNSGLIIIGIYAILTFINSYIQTQQLMADLNSSSMQMDLPLETWILQFGVQLLVLLVVLFAIITIEARWLIFKKAGKQGWLALIPIVNIITLLEIVKKPQWWIILLLIPVVNIAILIMMTHQLSLRFGKEEGFTAGLILLPFIFYPLLGMSELQFKDSAVASEIDNIGID